MSVSGYKVVLCTNYHISPWTNEMHQSRGKFSLSQLLSLTLFYFVKMYLHKLNFTGIRRFELFLSAKEAEISIIY